MKEALDRRCSYGPLPLDPCIATTYSSDDLETLAFLKKTYEPQDEKQRPTCEFQHGRLVDEIAAKRISKPGKSDSSKLTWSPDAEAIASHARGPASESLVAKARFQEKAEKIKETYFVYQEYQTKLDEYRRNLRRDRDLYGSWRNVVLNKND